LSREDLLCLTPNAPPILEEYVKTVILAGGFGTRISEETSLKPKPMVEVGGRPLLWHIMKTYANYGLTEFIVCCGYKGYVIKEYFANYFLHNSDVTFHLAEDRVDVHNNFSEKWSVTLVDTGLHTQTGGRLKRVREYLPEGQPFCMTYGDGLADVDIGALLSFYEEKKKLVAVTAVQPRGRFGSLELADDASVEGFREKPEGQGWMSGGFFVMMPQVLDYIGGDATPWEKAPLEILTAEGQVVAYKHRGFWQPVDMLRDKNYVEELWEKGEAPWKVWA
jgi:glucose-1-phosphate cytidylyltransferase